MLTPEKLESKAMYLYSRHIEHHDNKHNLRSLVYKLRYKHTVKKYIKYLILNYNKGGNNNE